MIMPKKSSFILFNLFFLPVFLFAQYGRGDGYSAISSQKPITDYFESVDDKSFYQSQRIHGMKREINDYSQRLHNLQTRFDEIFYGLSRGGSFQKPFDTELSPTRPERESLYDSKVSVSPGLPSTSNPGPVSPGRVPADLFEPEEQNPVNQLAFQVEAPGTYTEGGETKALFNPKSQASNGMGKYFILTPGFAIPYKVHKPSIPISNKEKYTRYDPGVSMLFAGGFQRNNFRFGLGGLYKRHQHHKSSYEFHTSYPGPSHRRYFQHSAETFAGFLDLSYESNLIGNLGGYIGLGLGYYLSIIEDPRRRLDHGLFATGNLGLAYNFNEMIALRLGYRYLHDEETPAHVAELGLDFEF